MYSMYTLEVKYCIFILHVKTVTAIYCMAGKFWSLKIQPISHFQGLKCPTILCDFPIQKLGTGKVPKVQIYLHNKIIASKQRGR